MPRLFLCILVSIFLGPTAPAQTLERSRLYTAPDPGSPGGLKGRVIKPEGPLEQILALPTADPEKVYQGEVTGAKRDTFKFTGLPVGKYDLVAVFEGDWFEGLQLHREPSTLTPEDTKKIETTIQKAEPFFTKRIVHRVEGQTGRGNLARCICTFVREKPSDLLMKEYQGQFRRDDFRRTFKLVMLKDVGPGWQIVRARDLYPIWADPKRPLPRHHFSSQLSQIRVADEVKDAGELDLSR